MSGNGEPVIRNENIQDKPSQRDRQQLIFDWNRFLSDVSSHTALVPPALTMRLEPVVENRVIDVSLC